MSVFACECGFRGKLPEVESGECPRCGKVVKDEITGDTVEKHKADAEKAAADAEKAAVAEVKKAKKVEETPLEKARG